MARRPRTRTGSRSRSRPSSERRVGTITTPMIPENLEEVLDELGLELGRSNSREVWSLCPNPDHEDTRPNSFSVNRDTGESYCFACGYNRDLTTIVADVLRLSPWEATTWLREHGATFSNLAARAVEGKRARKEKQRAQEREHSTYKELSLEARFGVFRDVPDAMLEMRRITREAVDAFEVRWDPEEKAWVIPCRLPEGEMIGWQLKGDGVFKNYPYRMSKSLTLFGFQEVEDAHPLVVVESPLDVLRVWDAGYDAVATWGVGYSKAQVGLIQTLLDSFQGALVMAYDNDPEGQEGHARLGREFMGSPIRVIDYEGVRSAKDVGEMFRDEIQQQVDSAKSILREPLPEPTRRRRVPR